MRYGAFLGGDFSRNLPRKSKPRNLSKQFCRNWDGGMSFKEGSNLSGMREIASISIGSNTVLPVFLRGPIYWGVSIHQQSVITQIELEFLSLIVDHRTDSEWNYSWAMVDFTEQMKGYFIDSIAPRHLWRQYDIRPRVYLLHGESNHPRSQDSSSILLST